MVSLCILKHGGSGVAGLGPRWSPRERERERERESNVQLGRNYGASAASQASPPLPSQPSVTMQAAPLRQGIMPPKPLGTTTNIAENWKQFKQIWEIYAIITNLTAQMEQYRVTLLLHCLGPGAMKNLQWKAVRQ